MYDITLDKLERLNKGEEVLIKEDHLKSLLNECALVRWEVWHYSYDHTINQVIYGVKAYTS